MKWNKWNAQHTVKTNNLFDQKPEYEITFLKMNFSFLLWLANQITSSQTARMTICEWFFKIFNSAIQLKSIQFFVALCVAYIREYVFYYIHIETKERGEMKKYSEMRYNVESE